MIVLLDVNKQIISLYTRDGIVDIKFQDVGSLYNIVGGDDILYVTNAIKTNAQKVIDMVKSMGVKVKNNTSIPSYGKKTYIHVKGEEIIPIDDLLRFRGHYDAHPLTSELLQKIKESSLLQSLIKNNKLELITSAERKMLEEERVRKEDERTGSILVDREELEQKGEHGNAEVIDFTSEVSGSRSITGESGANTMSELAELMENIEGFEGL